MCSKPAPPEGANTHFDENSSVAAELCDDRGEHLLNMLPAQAHVVSVRGCSCLLPQRLVVHVLASGMLCMHAPFCL